MVEPFRLDGVEEISTTKIRENYYENNIQLDKKGQEAIVTSTFGKLDSYSIG